MTNLQVVGLTVTCEISDKVYGNGDSRHFTLEAKVPDGMPGTRLTDLDDVIQDGLEMYFAAWQMALQTKLATRGMNREQYEEQVASTLRRSNKVFSLYREIKGKTDDELKVLISVLKERTPNVPVNNGSAQSG